MISDNTLPTTTLVSVPLFPRWGHSAGQGFCRVNQKARREVSGCLCPARSPVYAGDCIHKLKINSWKVGGRGGAAKQDYLYRGELSLCPNPAQSWEAANWEQPAQEAA